MDGMTIGGLAELAGVNVETVRYYERRGLLAQPDRTGRRRYTEQSLQRLALIRRAKNLGFTLAEIGELLDAANDPTDRPTTDPTTTDPTTTSPIHPTAHGQNPNGPTAQSILDAAHAKLLEVESDLRELEARRLRLAQLVRACAAGDDDCVTLLPNPTRRPS